MRSYFVDENRVNLQDAAVKNIKKNLEDGKIILDGEYKMIKKRNCPIELLSNYDKNWGLPKYENPGDAGFDLRAAFKEEYVDLISIPNFIKNFRYFKKIFSMRKKD